MVQKTIAIGRVMLLKDPENCKIVKCQVKTLWEKWG
jgi:hypothetical protein